MALRIQEQAIDAIAYYIGATDNAWDFIRIKTERAKLRELGTHPLDIYYAGDTRYDLDAQIRVPGELGLGKPTITVREYLIGKPVLFELRRLGARESARVRTKLAAESGIELEAFVLAAHYGCTAILGGEDEGILWREEPSGGGLAFEVLDKLDVIPGLVQGLGIAVRGLSKVLTAAEGKH